MKKSVAKNTAFMTMASVGQKLIAFVYFTIVARTLGADATGMYVTALAFTTLFVVFVDLGMTNVLIRESAKYKDNMQQYFSVVLMNKLFLGVLSYIALFIAANALGYDIALRHLIYLSGVTMLFDSLHLSLYGVLRAIGDLRFEAAGIVGSQATTLILGGIALYLGLPLIFLILAFTIPSGLNALFAMIVLYRNYGVGPWPRFDREVFVHLGKITIPFALAAVFARVYSYIDTILLSKLAGTTAVGWYAIPYKITFAFQFIPLALVAALYPRFSEFFVKDKKKLAKSFEQAMKYLMLIVFPISVGIGVLAEDIILLLYTDAYVHSIVPLQILISGLIFSYLSFPIGAMLNACNKQVVQTTIIGVVMVINIVLNVLFIPQFGILGAAAAALIGNVVLAFAGYMVIPQITKVNHGWLLRMLLLIGASAAVMGIVVFYVQSIMHFVLAIVVGVLVYPVMLFITRAVRVAELQEARALLRRS